MARTLRQKPAAVRPPLPTLSVAEAAAIAHVVRRTIGRWVDEERFLSSRPIAAGSGKRLIDRASFFAFLGIEAA